MSLNAILNTAQSGLTAAQTQLRVVSDNVSNVNTPGYVRKIADQRTMSSAGVGSGVEIARIRLATDRFLQAASLNAGAESARQGVRYELYDRIQELFGDPGGDSGFFSQVDGLFSSFAAAAETPGSSPLRQEALFKTQAMFDEAGRIAKQIQAARQDADGRVQSAVEKANSLLGQIEALNLEISRATIVNADASGAETAQSALIGQLAELMDVRVDVRPIGGVIIRTGNGTLLAGQGAATIEYTRAGTVNAETAFNEIWITEPGGQKKPLLENVTSGEIKGLVETRDVEAPQAAERLAELMSHIADELNRAHNANASVPPPNVLTGRNVGQTFASAIAGFTGTTTIAVANRDGVIQSKVDIVFGPPMTIGGAPANPTDFLTVLNTQLGGTATASFTDGKLSIRATNANNGVAIADADGAAKTDKAGRGFSHYFGLNDLVSADRIAFYDTGMMGSSPHGFTAGETLTFRFTGENGAKVRDLQVAIPAGGTVDHLLAALNDSATGLGRFGRFTLDGSGVLSFSAYGQPAPTMTVLQDTTTQVPSGVSLTELFGIGRGARASRADDYSLRADIRQSPAKLALAQLDRTAAVGATGISPGDGRGALRLADAGEYSAKFHAAGGAGGGMMSVSRYASELSGDIGGRAAAAKTGRDTAKSLYSEAQARQVAQEGVNLDEELVLMTTYQQAFNASARLIQAAKDMYDILLGLT